MSAGGGGQCARATRTDRHCSGQVESGLLLLTYTRPVTTRSGLNASAQNKHNSSGKRRIYVHLRGLLFRRVSSARLEKTDRRTER
jgi:hypothetical protein